jgi:phosphoribosylformimino-5-aminoimidazole carboxamide ribotide isomerase
MIAVPAIDLRAGRCVQLVGGRPEEERVSLPDPVAQARTWWNMGFKTLHIIDLDAALSVGDNRQVVRTVVEATTAEVQLGGGIRDEASLEEALLLGVRRAIVGTRALDDPNWLVQQATSHPHRIMVAADIRGGVVVRKGWTESTGVPILELLDRLSHLPLAGILCTDVSREGQMKGADLSSAEEIIRKSNHPLWVSGGITTMEELRALDRAGAAGAVLGMAIYTGTLSPERVAEEFGA